jgi:hypothetical protein
MNRRKMLGQSIWWGSIALEVLLLVRALRASLVSRYPAFYCYVFFVLALDVLCLFTYQRYPQLYNYSYGTTEFLCVLVGCGLVFEVYRIGLSPYPGTARMARNVLASVFVLALAKALTTAAGDPRWWLEASTLEIERTLRTVQAIAIVALVALFLFYSISFGRNLRGILLGYGLFIGLRVICLAFVSSEGRDFWFYAYSASYPAALGIWLAHLWSYSEVPGPTVGRLEKDYQTVAAATRRRLQTARGQLAKAVRS